MLFQLSLEPFAKALEYKVVGNPSMYFVSLVIAHEDLVTIVVDTLQSFAITVDLKNMIESRTYFSKLIICMLTISFSSRTLGWNDCRSI
jgi:hypothetical protein